MEIVSTPGHKYFLPETKKWVSAEDLKVGVKVLLSDGSYGIIEAVRAIHYDEPQTTYNFEVSDFHTYYVGNGVLVHNMNGGGCGGANKRRTPDQQAVADLAKEAKKRGGITSRDAKTLMGWADDYGFPIPSRGPELSQRTGSIWSKIKHFHIAGIDHIPLI